MGWVSLFEPESLKQLLNMPSDSHPIAILCLGHVDSFYEKPMLSENWTSAQTIEHFIYENQWEQPCSD